MNVRKWLYYASNPLRGACFAKASQPEGAEDMSKGARGGRFFPAVAGHADAWILDWMEAELIAQKCGGPYYAPNPLCGGATKGAPGGREIRG